MFAEFEPSAFTWWENIPREFGGWDNVAVAGFAAIAAAALVVFLFYRIACRIAHRVR